MKKTLVLLIALAAVCIIPPFFLSDLIESEYQKVVKNVNLNQGVDMTTSFTATGWNKAKVVHNITLDLATAETPPFTIIVEEDLTYGPVIFVNGLHFSLSYSQSSVGFAMAGLPQEEIDEFVTELNKNLHITSEISYNVNATTSFILDEIKKEHDGNHITLNSAQGKVTIMNAQEAAVNMQWGGLEVSNGTNNLKVKNIVIDSEQKAFEGSIYQNNYLATGFIRSSVEELSIHNAITGESYIMKALEFIGQSTIEDKLLLADAQYTINEIQAAGMHIKDVNLDIAINRIDAQVLNRLIQKASNLPENIKSEEDRTQFITQLLAESSGELMATEPEMMIKDLSFITDNGHFKSDAKFSVDKSLFQAGNPQSFVHAIDISGKAEITEAMLAIFNMQALVDFYVAQGFAKRENTEIKTTFTYDAAGLKVNDNVIPLAL